MTCARCSAWELGDGCDEPLDVAARQRQDVELQQLAAAADVGAQQRVEVGPLRRRTAGEDREDPETRESPQDVREELEARRVGQVGVVEQQDERPVGARVLDGVHRRLEQPRSCVLGRGRGAVSDERAAEPPRQ